MDAESFTNTMKIARRVVATYVSTCYQKFERSKRLHEALVSRKWPEISYVNLELRHIYVKNGLPCFCGIEVSTLDQLADTLVKMHVSSIHRANALDTCLLDMGIPTWTPTLNRSMRLLSSQFVQYGVATVTKDFVLTSANCVGQNILSSPEYKRQMSLWRLAQQQQIDVVAALAEVGDFVHQVVLDWISRGVVHTSHKHGGTINSVDGILEFLVDHYRPKSCSSCRKAVGVSGVNCSFCELAICKSCVCECYKCGAKLCGTCSAIIYSNDTSITLCMGGCAL
ncbi:hypothetical protein H257_01112 [Aphanomyces astaci]|uniref:Uncharacterized protein n=1 Tax=Aphanomyces astaci TaxID=112090 RepID=W4H7Q8_APHAT|nr:hypothetical protein H257_01112 [Aphanomyces astaci]ETV87586.1 hypothetical protein H257_01112 [Aphanomyces astaci]|eukprot:XP_009822449.1 hypothetical protein H257_01112 [Aphanomyces astaci]